MYLINTFIILCCLFTVLVNLTGCSQKDLYPKADLIIDSETFNLIPQSATELPPITYSVTPLNGVTCTLESYSIEYSSYLKEPIPSLALDKIPINVRIAGTEDSSSEGESVSLELYPFTTGVRELFSKSPSDISPILAKITIYYRDVNSNNGSIETYCSLFKYDSANAETEATDG